MTPISEAARKAAERCYVESSTVPYSLPFYESIIQQAISSECAARDALIVELRDELRTAALAIESEHGNGTASDLFELCAKIPADMQGKAVVDAAELEEANKDTRRLELLYELGAVVRYDSQGVDGRRFILSINGEDIAYGGSVRAAIDSARERARAGKEAP